MITKKKLGISIIIVICILIFFIYIKVSSCGCYVFLDMLSVILFSFLLGVFTIGYTFPEIHNNKGDKNE